MTYELYKILFCLRHGHTTEHQCRDGFWKKRQKFGGNFMMEIEKGVKFYFDLKDELCYQIFVRDFEKNERAFVNSFLRPGDIFFDIGANIGLFTVLGAAKVAPQGSVHAFEPLREPAENLRKNVRINNMSKLVLVNCFGLSDKKGVQKIWQCEEGFSAFSSMGKPILDTGSRMTEIEVKVEMLDHYVDAHKISQIALIKMDVEGWEHKVLEGASRTLTAQSPVILIEFTDGAAANAGSSTLALRQKLESMGYRFYEWNDRDKKLEAHNVHQKYGYKNLIACKSTHVIEDRMGICIA